MEAAWHRDPFGRHDWRWHDGEQWTEHVTTAGVAAVDPPAASAPGQALVPMPPAPLPEVIPPATITTPQVVVAVPQQVTSSTVATSVRIHTHRSVFWWFFIGWWYVPIKWLIGWPIVIYRRLTGRRPGDIKVKIQSEHQHASGPG